MMFSPNTRILVRRGGTLTLTANQFQTHLSGMCNSVWQGIQAEGPGYGVSRAFDTGTGFVNYGRVQATDNVLIEDAIIGIATQNLPLIDVYNIGLLFDNNAVFNPQNTTLYPTLTAVLLTAYHNQATALATAGGVVAVDHNRVVFNNCFHGINLSWYNNIDNGQPQSIVRRANFISDGLKYPFSNLFAQPLTEAGVYMLNYQFIEIGVTTGSVTGNTFSNLKYGIRSENTSDVLIFNNAFNNCAVGISAASADISPLSSVYKVVANQIDNCGVAMQFSGTAMTIAQNGINTAPNSAGRIGIFVRGRTNFIIAPLNIINNNLLGCVLMNTSLTPNSIRNNDFNNNVIGIWAFGNNGQVGVGGVQITCNRFDNGAVALSTQDYMVNGNLLTTGSLDNQGNCVGLGQNPADNVFNQSPVFVPGILTDIIATQTGGVYTYSHRADMPGIAQFMPTITGNVVNSECIAPTFSPEANCENRNLLTDEAIRGIDVTAHLNREMLEKARYYEEQGDTAAAIALLQSVNNEFAKHLLLQKYITNADTALANATIAALPSATLEQQHFRRTAEIQWALKSQRRTYLQLTPEETTDLRSIAATYSPAAHHAQTMLLIAYGEEYPATLPDLPAFLDTATLNLLMQEGINFKNNPDKQKAKIGNLYPNPAQNMIYLPYNLPDADMAVFNLYDPTGRLLYSEKLYKTGLMRYSVEHLPMGIYYYQIAINGQPLQYNKFVLVK